MERQAICRAGAQMLAAAGVPEPDLDAALLFEYVTGLPRAAVLADPLGTVPEEQEEAYFACIRERVKRIPLQHITGEQIFMGLPFVVNADVLIPRQDTETLVEAALQFLKPGRHILDLGTGSGCILLSLLKLGPVGLSGVGVDCSREALAVARQNAEALQVEADFRESDLFDQVTEPFDLIISNPPYIPTGELSALQAEVQHDPRIALDGGADGLSFYRRIIRESQGHLRRGGALYLEIGAEQAKEVTTLMTDAGYVSVRVQKDLSGLDRVVSGMYNR